MTSVFSNHEPSKDLFVGNPVSIARYDQLVFPAIDKLTEKQMGYFWTPNEIDCTKDGRDFKLLTPHEQHIFTSNLKRQILLDSVQGRAPSMAFLPLASVPEIENWIITWSFFETIHSRSYSHIIRNIYNDPSKVFDDIMDIKEIVDCATDISKHYDTLINATENDYDDRSKKEALWMALMAVSALEGIRFYVSFACSWAFAEVKKMEGNAKIIKFICMSDDHEILTNEGWKLFKDLNKTELVAQYTNQGEVEFVKPINYIEEDYVGPMYNYTSQSFDVSYTPDHRVIYSIDGEIKEDTAENFNPSCKKNYIATGIKTSGRNIITDFERFRIAVQADGHIPKGYNGKIVHTIPVTFSLKKERKIERLTEILNKIKLDYKVTHNTKGYTLFKVNVPTHYNIDKTFDWIELNDISYVWARDFLIEMSQWDGYLKNDDFSHIYYSTINSQCADMVQAISAISGWMHHRTIQIDERKDTYSDVHRIYIHTEKTTYNCLSKSDTKTVTQYDGKVYCVTVPSGMIVVRRNNKVIVTGNCRDENLHLAAVQQIMKYLVKNDPNYFEIKTAHEDECTKLYQDVIDQEKAWAKYLFKDGSMIGLNADLLIDYIDHIGGKRASSAGLKIPYNVNNPLPWTQKWIAGDDVQVAPQEVELSSYIIGGIKMDIDEKDLKGLKL